MLVVERKIGNACVVFRILPDIQVLASDGVDHLLYRCHVDGSDLEESYLTAKMGLWSNCQAIIIFPLSDECSMPDSPRIALPIKPAFAAEATVDNGPRRDAMRFEWHVYLKQYQRNCFASV